MPDVDGTPSWQELLPSFLTMLETSQRPNAIAYLETMARAADGYPVDDNDLSLSGDC